ncbi:protoporphyrinogen oxidase [Actinoplanes sp. NBRC 103695]|uniref:protoporphyrinogen oxidase n=1 Tax=Actinoplanes sp. NBRC 103695 TaxID=3032202 RepID=UPI0024A327E7|nr:protoporphyrinogen oxidase [Actinoplanes sp. NBRC 103695]GLY94844.1 protoporphyrinogen oxidase [Actinoplanes sp. NBRC 103695]
MRKRVAIVGGGIAGLSAALKVRELAPPQTEIIVYEQSGVLGGKLRTGSLGGVTVERGAESFLMGAPSGGPSAAARLAARLGLSLAHPAGLPAAIASDDLSPLPPGTLMGIPRDSSETPSPAPLLGAGSDISVGDLVSSRLGPDVVDQLVDPLLGGVYAGQASGLSLAATIPALAAAARHEHTLAAAVRAAQAASKREPGAPVFGTVDGGMTRFVAALAAACGARISLGLPVRELLPATYGWRLMLGPVPATQTDDVHAVILAVPARAAARLLDGIDPAAAATVGVLDYASVALAGFALPPGTELPSLSGFLVPPSRGTLVKAATFVTSKWTHLAGPGGPVIVRASLGRYGEQARLQHDDRTLLATAHAELGDLIGTPLPPPAEAWVQRWGGGLPQYAPGHLDRVGAVRAALAGRPGLALAGAAYDGVGIPACVASGETAAETVCKILED